MNIINPCSKKCENSILWLENYISRQKCSRQYCKIRVILIKIKWKIYTNQRVFGVAEFEFTGRKLENPLENNKNVIWKSRKFYTIFVNYSFNRAYSYILYNTTTWVTKFCNTSIVI